MNSKLLFSALGLSLASWAWNGLHAGPLAGAQPQDENHSDAGQTVLPEEVPQVVATEASVTAPVRAMEERAFQSMRSLELSALVERERRDWSAREAKLLRRIDELQAELINERRMRTDREFEWLEFTRALAVLEVPNRPEAPDFLGLPPLKAEEAKPHELREEEAAQQRSRELLTQLRAMLAAEQVHGIDVLETGTVQDGWCGPFVARLVDEYGRPTGSLAAERLRLEMSYAAHTVTLVLEDGYENRGGVRVPFKEGQKASQSKEKQAQKDESLPADRRGVRRIHLPGVNPADWIEAMPELFGDFDQHLPVDDGKWDRSAVRVRVNELLAKKSAANGWRVRGIGGIYRGELRDVHWAEVDLRGSITRRLFADRCKLSENGKGIRIDLYGGVQVRGSQQVPFLDGRFRIMLPQALASDWVEAGLPGLVPGTPQGEELTEPGSEAPSGG